MSESLIEVKNLTKYFYIKGSKSTDGQRKFVHAVEDVSFSIGKGEIFGVVGESGSGKSTLGRCMIRLLSVDSGEINFNGNDITHLNRHEMKKYITEMQMVFQNPFSSFNPKMTLWQSLSEVCRVRKMSRKESRGRIGELLEYVNLSADTLDRLPGQLSGGQLQRLAIARSLIVAPRFIVADEPVSALDVSVQGQILNVMQDLNKQMNLAILFISHELTVVRHMCDRVAVMYLGMVVELANTYDLFERIKHPYTQYLISAKPKEHPLEKKEHIILEGEIPDAVDVPKGCRFVNRCPRFQKGTCDELLPKFVEVEKGHFVACHNPIN